MTKHLRLVDGKPLERESDIQRSILDYLALRGYVCWRNNTGAVYGEHKGKSRFFRYGKVGSGDILGMTKQGRFFSIEVKAAKGIPTEHQYRFMADVNASNGLAFVARSVEDVIKNGL